MTDGLSAASHSPLIPFYKAQDMLREPQHERPHHRRTFHPAQGTLTPLVPLSLRAIKGEGERRTEADVGAERQRLPLVQYWREGLGRTDGGGGALFAEGAASEGEECEGHADDTDTQDGGQALEQGLGVPADHEQGTESVQQVGNGVVSSDCR